LIWERRRLAGQFPWQVYSAAGMAALPAIKPP
jgi:hypothetical protein